MRDMSFNLDFYLNNIIIVIENSCNFEVQMLAWIIKEIEYYFRNEAVVGAEIMYKYFIYKGYR